MTVDRSHHDAVLDWTVQRAANLASKAVNRAPTGIGARAPLPASARLETHGGPRCDVQPKAACALTVEDQSRVGLEEMVVRADLDRTITGVGHGDGNQGSARVQLELAFAGGDGAGGSLLRAPAQSDGGR